MSIGSTIKRLRREKDITQEQLAGYLGITSRAISQWECDRTAPDISQLPALCHIFNVSSDVLLGIDIDKTKDECQARRILKKDGKNAAFCAWRKVHLDPDFLNDLPVILETLDKLTESEDN